jgi:hypothetical protein
VEKRAHRSLALVLEKVSRVILARACSSVSQFRSFVRSSQYPSLSLFHRLVVGRESSQCLNFGNLRCTERRNCAGAIGFTSTAIPYPIQCQRSFASTLSLGT